MEREQGTPWTQLIGHTNIQKRGNGQQTRRLEHPNSTQLMDHYLRTMSQVDMHRQTASWRQWLSLKSLTPESLKTHVLRRWKLFSKQE
ncbi:PB1-F2 protein [Influenza A virus]|uniref:Protein PB1-F2 n=2 Tax=Influenza A virus TaxID=11320 RepID=A0A7G8C776_9INFA|nr:PB1-F2 protein [Influenza A virus (A/chicken/Rostock/45/1934(H7N1))]ADR23777.1 PB1-F2 protein [Influenza A virus (A/chicken/Rostock/45/1934(H7N1))]QNI40656.1 PB1-F2 protein [Influenza A virus]QNJ34135.1 PB1-F2 protein [Influenza A virus]QNJ34147.1 PB1-F2 protein [Influenza A virus]